MSQEETTQVGGYYHHQPVSQEETTQVGSYSRLLHEEYTTKIKNILDYHTILVNARIVLPIIRQILLYLASN